MPEYRGKILEVEQHRNPQAGGRWKTRTQVKTELGWMSYGFDKIPPFAEGDTVEFTYTENGQYKNIDTGSCVIVPKQEFVPKDVPTSRSEVVTTVPRAPAPDWDKRNSQIVMQHSQEMSARVLAILLAHNALPLPAANTKAQIASRYDAAMAIYDKLTVRFYNDAISLRLLDTVSDSPNVSNDERGDDPAMESAGDADESSAPAAAPQAKTPGRRRTMAALPRDTVATDPDFIPF